MKNYRYNTLMTKRGVELQQKYIVEVNGQTIVLSYRIVDGETVSKNYLRRNAAVKKFVDTSLDKPRLG